ncbi:uncharacterized protein LOC128856376 [Anastrepha ludens]|uniref:uncharacterized protein LOC128856376 n=1 Tax=Anastrepha ludens TaxID=28586 RepID=UPI0023B02AE8|nr:uncharacterized protein LOC128856376 [Anastrepha ludens]
MHIPCPIKLGAPDSLENELSATYARLLAYGLLILTSHWNQNNLQAVQRFQRQMAAPGPQTRHAHQHNQPERQRSNGRRILLQDQRTKLRRVRDWWRANKRYAAERPPQTPQTPLLEEVRSTAGDGPLI